jgi:hypothetical protein
MEGGYDMKNRIYMTERDTYIFDSERKYFGRSEYDSCTAFRIVSPDKDGRDPDDPCADDLKADRSLERKIYNWIKRAVKPRRSNRKKR